uniref:Uncharacterized protein n=1 Tax=Kuetzingia canaliculata TaxID=228262 RepID=A0A1Z1MP45_KUECA|nr:hypothetical protein [Kuetzingia canaliculata]ARW67870.1 hypothetical protein [Kuetzingia canaliculata]
MVISNLYLWHKVNDCKTYYDCLICNVRNVLLFIISFMYLI